MAKSNFKYLTQEHIDTIYKMNVTDGEEAAINACIAQARHTGINKGILYGIGLTLVGYTVGSAVGNAIGNAIFKVIKKHTDRQATKFIEHCKERQKKEVSE